MQHFSLFVEVCVHFNNDYSISGSHTTQIRIYSIYGLTTRAHVISIGQFEHSPGVRQAIYITDFVAMESYFESSIIYILLSTSITSLRSQIFPNDRIALGKRRLSPMRCKRRHFAHDCRIASQLDLIGNFQNTLAFKNEHSGDYNF